MIVRIVNRPPVSLISRFSRTGCNEYAAVADVPFALVVLSGRIRRELLTSLLTLCRDCRWASVWNPSLTSPTQVSNASRGRTLFEVNAGKTPY